MDQLGNIDDIQAADVQESCSLDINIKNLSMIDIRFQNLSYSVKADDATYGKSEI
jgi:hypothetical protein